MTHGLEQGLGPLERLGALDAVACPFKELGHALGEHDEGAVGIRRCVGAVVRDIPLPPLSVPLDASACGVPWSAFGIGGMAASLWLANRNRIEGTTTILLLGTATSGVLTAVFASTDSFAAALAIMVVLGAAGSATMNGAQILIQNAVEGSMRARVMSLYSFNYRAAPALGAMAMGGASTVVGLQFPVAAGALLLLAIWYWVFLRRRLRQALETGGGAPLEARPKVEESPAE